MSVRRWAPALVGCLALGCAQKDVAWLGSLRAPSIGQATSGFRATGSMSVARQYGTATLLPSGQVLFAGGLVGGATAELYDPRSGTFLPTSSMGIDRAYAAAALLLNGKVLVAGGMDASGGTLASAELYDPGGESWEPTGPMRRARTRLTATVLDSGQVLVIGGPDAELYDPATGTWSLTGPLVQGTGDTTATLLPSGQVLVAGGASAAAQLYDPATNSWRATGAMTRPRDSHTATLLATGQVLVAGGKDPQTGKTLLAAELYDPAAEAWTPTSDSLVSGLETTATLLPSGALLVTGGRDSELYDPPSGSWRSSGPLAFTRDQGTATLLASGKVLFAGGVATEAELYDPGAGGWTAAAPPALARSGATMTLLPSGKVLLAGGQDGAAPLASAELYDPATDAWTATGSMAAARARHTATLLLDGRVLVAGGEGVSGPTAAVEIYDPAQETWSGAAPMEIGRAGHTATLLLDHRVLVAGGDGAGALASAELYRPATGTWRTAGTMGAARAGHAATLLLDGSVLVTGGQAGALLVGSAERYDPAVDRWSSAGALSLPRAHHTATLLWYDLVLVAGGEDASGPVADTESYSPLRGEWSRAPSMASARSRHTATRLASGELLVSGGTGSAGAEIYDEAVHGWTAVASPGRARVDAASALLPSGEVLVAGGSAGGAERYEPTGASGGRGPVVSAPPAASSTLALSGARFRGISEGSGGSIHGNSASNAPVVKLLPVSGGDRFSPALQSFSGTSISLEVSAIPDGHYVAAVTANGIAAGALTFIDGAPVMPVVTGPAPFVNRATPLITGHAEPLIPVAVVVDGVPAGGTSADGDGAWSLTPPSPLAEGGHEAWASTVDGSGHGSASLPHSFTVDLTAPDAPSVIAPPALVNTTQVKVVGMSERGAAVQVWLDGSELGTSVADESGVWRVGTPDLSQGTHAVVAQATDPAGNTGASTAPWTFDVDSVPPPTPVVLTPASGAPLSTPQPVISGTAEAGSFVAVLLDGLQVDTVAAAQDGTWSFTPSAALAEGPHTAAVSAQDLAGNVSLPTGPRPFVVDTVAPAPPVLAAPADGTAVGSTAPVFSGTAEANSAVRVAVDGAAIGSATASGTGQWSLASPPLAEGTHTAVARAADAAGNLSPASNAATFTVDTAMPAAPIIVAPVDGAFVGTATPAIDGFAEARTVVIVEVDGARVDSVVASSTGSWSLTPPVLAEGAHAVTVRSNDAAGNASPPASVSFTVDTVAPPAPRLVFPRGDSTVRTPTPELLGTAEPWSTVSVTLDGEVAGRPRTDEAGDWSFTPEAELADGQHLVVLQATDAAGNAGPASVPQSFTVQRPKGYYGGCSAAPPGAFGAWLLLLAWRRRRSAPRR